MTARRPGSILEACAKEDAGKVAEGPLEEGELDRAREWGAALATTMAPSAA